MNSWDENRKRVQHAINQFPARFGLKAFPGKVFCLSQVDSYVSDDKVLLYAHVFDVGSEQWEAFAKGTPEEIQGQIEMGDIAAIGAVFLLEDKKGTYSTEWLDKARKYLTNRQEQKK